MENVQEKAVTSTAMSLIVNAMLLTDGYKLGHRNMYPNGMTKLYSNFTPRSDKHFTEAENGCVVFGIQYFIKKYLLDEFNNNFFKLSEDEVVRSYRSLLEGYLGKDTADAIGTEHVAELHRLGYLPIRVKALPEGIYCPIGVPVLTITNTDEKFAWLTNYLETLLSTVLWKPMNNATMADIFKRELVRHAEKTGFLDVNDTSNLDFLCHDFSMRGMSGVEDAMVSSMAHMTSFSGCETLPAILGAQHYYGAGPSVAGTVPATEHSIECSNATDFDGNADDEVYFKAILDKFRSGFISIVADGYDYWNFIGKIVPRYKNEIMSRDGRVVIRPDSGDPVKIICGDPQSDDPIVRMGSYEWLFTVFGGTVNEKGYKVLDPHIGLIYGDSINMKRQREIYRLLEEKGFAATNLVLGIGSFSYQVGVGRDNLGFAMKATYCEINGKGKEIFKDPKTVVGMPKKSLRGLICVVRDVYGKIHAIDQVMPEMESWENMYETPWDYMKSDKTLVRIKEDLLHTVFENGEMKGSVTFDEIRSRHNEELFRSMGITK